MPPNGESETQVMNPLVGPTLSSRSSMHCLDAAPEPQRKKLRLSGSFHGDEVSKNKNAAVTSTNTTTLENTPQPQPTLSNRDTKPQESHTSTHVTSAVSTPPPKPAVVASSPVALPEKPQSGAGIPPKSNENSQSKPKQDGQAFMGYAHLKEKYYDELSYMLREFEKLERQLLGARKTEENAGSRERREKLHSFIIHLQDTITQIETGVQQEEISQKGSEQESSARVSQETIQKLEEHILANLLPVKVRLKKQLAAQQGARHNPVGMPHRAYNQKPKDDSKGTFAAAAEKKRQQEEAAVGVEARAAAKPVEPSQTQYGKPITNGGSSLTKKLHGQTLGKSEAQKPSPVAKVEKESKRYYGGMALGSDQIESSVTAASSVHKLIIKDTELLLHNNKAEPQPAPAPAPEPKVDQPPVKEASAKDQKKAETIPKLVVEPKEPATTVDLQDQERRRRRRRRRRKRMLREQERKGVLSAEGDASKLQSKKSRQAKKQRGPRQVEYMCALCNETYAGTCEFNPWWALTQHDCPKCHKTQIPKVDISAAANAIEYHPALLAHADDGSNTTNTVPPPLPPDVELVVSTPSTEPPEDHISLGSDVSSGLDDVSSDEDDLMDMDSDADDSACLTPADKAENEHFGAQYEGPKLEPEDAAKLIALMSHASTCCGHHKSKGHRDVCRSTQWMMLHVRDCPGTTASGDICPFPWCRKVKHLLYHLVSCQEGPNCPICAGHLSDNMQGLVGLNKHRFQLYRERLFSSCPEERAAARVVQTVKATKTSGTPKAPRPSNEAKEVSKAKMEKATEKASHVVKSQKSQPPQAAIQAHPAVLTSPSLQNTQPPQAAIHARPAVVTAPAPASAVLKSQPPQATIQARSIPVISGQAVQPNIPAVSAVSQRVVAPHPAAPRVAAVPATARQTVAPPGPHPGAPKVSAVPVTARQTVAPQGPHAGAHRVPAVPVAVAQTAPPNVAAVPAAAGQTVASPAPHPGAPRVQAVPPVAVAQTAPPNVAAVPAAAGQTVASPAPHPGAPRVQAVPPVAVAQTAPPNVPAVPAAAGQTVASPAPHPGAPRVQAVPPVAVAQTAPPNVPAVPAAAGQTVASPAPHPGAPVVPVATRQTVAQTVPHPGDPKVPAVPAVPGQTVAQTAPHPGAPKVPVVPAVSGQTVAQTVPHPGAPKVPVVPAVSGQTVAPSVPHPGAPKVPAASAQTVTPTVPHPGVPKASPVPVTAAQTALPSVPVAATQVQVVPVTAGQTAPHAGASKVQAVPVIAGQTIKTPSPTTSQGQGTFETTPATSASLPHSVSPAAAPAPAISHSTGDNVTTPSVPPTMKTVEASGVPTSSPSTLQQPVAPPIPAASATCAAAVVSSTAPAPKAEPCSDQEPSISDPRAIPSAENKVKVEPAT